MFSDFTMPIIHVLNTGTATIDDPFNFFFSLMVGIAFLLFIPLCIMKLIQRS